MHARLLKILLRVGGVATLLAFPTMLLPVEWMAVVHRWSGLGEFPRAPIVDYLTRSIAALYGFYGGLLLLVASDLAKYKSVIAYIAWMTVAFGAMMVLVDLHAGMPPGWTAFEGPPIIVSGLIAGWLNRRVAGSRRG